MAPYNAAFEGPLAPYRAQRRLLVAKNISFNATRADFKSFCRGKLSKPGNIKFFWQNATFPGRPHPGWVMLGFPHRTECWAAERELQDLVFRSRPVKIIKASRRAYAPLQFESAVPPPPPPPPTSAAPIAVDSSSSSSSSNNKEPAISDAALTGSTAADPDNGSAPSPMTTDKTTSDQQSVMANSTEQEHNHATAPAPTATSTDSTSPVAELGQLVVSNGFPGEDDDNDSYDGYNSEGTELSVDFGL